MERSESQPVEETEGWWRRRRRVLEELPATAWADAQLVGWLPLVAVNAVFAQRVHVELDAWRHVLHHAYDAGQILGLAALSWLVVRALSGVPRVARILVALGLAFLASHALLATDLDSFIERHPESHVPWRLVFAAVGTAGLAGSVAFGLGLALVGRALRFVGVAIGAALGVGNHLVLELAYPGAHFLLAWSAALLIGTSLVRDLARLGLSRGARIAVRTVGILSFASYALVPGPVVRGALLGSSGAVAAPFVAQVWTALEGDADADAEAAIQHFDPVYFRSRYHLSPVPAERLPGAPKAPIVLLVTIDALRADAIDGKDVDRRAARYMRAMASKGLSFQQAWSPAAYTMASLRSLFLGVHYFQQGKKREKVKQPFLAAILAAHGVATVNVKAVRSLDVKGSVARGFREQIAMKKGAATAKEVVSAIVKRLDGGVSGPLFLYTHIFDPHAPYVLGSRDESGTEWERYLREIAYVDRGIGKLRRALHKSGLDKRTYLIVSADHAEAFGEHGHKFHATTVYEEMIHVPLIFEGPGIPKRRVRTPVTLVDVPPTVLSLFGVDAPPHYMGQSLVPFMRGESPTFARPLAVDGGRAIRAMLFGGRWKAIVDVRRGTEELYDLQTDPGERKNLAERPEARPYFATLRAFFAQKAE